MMGDSSDRLPSVFILGVIGVCAAVLFAILGFAFLMGPRGSGPREVGWEDPRGDVELSNADVVAGSITVWEGLVDIRATFAASPFPSVATHHVTWCFDTDFDSASGGACGFGSFIGADVGFTLSGTPGALETCDFSANGSLSGVDVRPYLWYDASSFSLRLLIPLSHLGGTESFRYLVESVFGGSFGANDLAPEEAEFTSSTGSHPSELGELPFAGTRLCAS